MNLSKKYILIFISIFMLYALFSCEALKKNIDIVDLEGNYEVRYKKDDRNKVFYNQLNGKKLNGYFKGNLRGENHKFLSYFKNGKQEGISLVFENDFLVSQYFYQNGLKDGLQYNYISDKYYVSTYKKGVKNGIERIYENGFLSRESHFNNGIKNGVEYYYNSLGKIIGEVEYKLLPNHAPAKLTDSIKTPLMANSMPPDLFQFWYTYKGRIIIRAKELENISHEDNYITSRSDSWLISSVIDNESLLYENNQLPYYYEVLYMYDNKYVLYDRVWLLFSLLFDSYTTETVLLSEITGHKLYNK